MNRAIVLVLPTPQPGLGVRTVFRPFSASPFVIGPSDRTCRARPTSFNWSNRRRSLDTGHQQQTGLALRPPRTAQNFTLVERPNHRHRSPHPGNHRHIGLDRRLPQWHYPRILMPSAAQSMTRLWKPLGGRCPKRHVPCKDVELDNIKDFYHLTLPAEPNSVSRWVRLWNFHIARPGASASKSIDRAAEGIKILSCSPVGDRWGKCRVLVAGSSTRIRTSNYFQHRRRTQEVGFPPSSVQAYLSLSLKSRHPPHARLVVSPSPFILSSLSTHFLLLSSPRFPSSPHFISLFSHSTHLGISPLLSPLCSITCHTLSDSLKTDERCWKKRSGS